MSGHGFLEADLNVQAFALIRVSPLSGVSSGFFAVSLRWIAATHVLNSSILVCFILYTRILIFHQVFGLQSTVMFLLQRDICMLDLEAN